MKEEELSKKQIKPLFKKKNLHKTVVDGLRAQKSSKENTLRELLINKKSISWLPTNVS